MKVNIGPYKNWWGIYQITELLTKVGVSGDTCYCLANKIDKKFPIINNVLNKIHEKRKRKIKIKIDAYDTFSCDTTLSHIILPLLKEFRKEIYGAPNVDDSDVPEHLKSTSAPKPEHAYDTDDNWFKRWEYVLDEIIWTFEQIADDNSESQFYDAVNNKLNFEGYDAHQLRISNGLKLFGKYYRSLWS